MDSFQKIVLAIATVILILILTIIGVMLTKYKNKVVYPPVANTCPDYWKISADGLSCSIPSSSAVNVGNIYKSDGSLAISSTDTYGYDSTNNTINFTDGGWSSSKSAVCAQKDWAGTYNLIWDGVSNYNSC